MGIEPKFIRTNKYLQGSVWHWNNSRDKTPGVQAGERPVIIVSNNNYNYFSPIVSCVTVSKTESENPARVPIHISVDSYVQTDQIHTVSKTELGEFLGFVSPPVLENIKGLLTLHFDLEIDRFAEVLDATQGIRSMIQAQEANWDILKGISGSLETLNQKADKGFGVKEIEEEFVNLVLELHKCVEKLTADVDKLKTTAAAPTLKSTQKPVITPVSIRKRKYKRYSEDDYRMIENENVSLEELAAHLKIDDLKSVYKIRYMYNYRNNRQKAGTGGGGYDNKLNECVA